MSSIILDERFEKVGLSGQVVLYTPKRYPKELIPKGIHAYDIRGTDDDCGELGYLESSVCINHTGMILAKKEIDLGKDGYLDIRDDLYFCEEECSLLEYMTEITGETSDGYHTFNELYHHRAVLFSIICNMNPYLSWKSKQHDDPEFPMYEDMFICGIETPHGQATYHYDIDPYWDMFHVKELEKAPKYDGHTPPTSYSMRRISGESTKYHTWSRTRLSLKMSEKNWRAIRRLISTCNKTGAET